MAVSVQPIETSIAFLCYVGALLYSLFEAYRFGNTLDVDENENSFTTGWSFLSRKRDDYDDEWESFVEHTRIYVYWYICHALLSEIVRLLEPHRICFAHATIGILFVCMNFKPIVALSMFFMIASYYGMMFTRKRYVWTLTVLWLIVLNILKRNVWQDWLSSMLTDGEKYDAMIALSWLLLRLTSFAVDYCNGKTEIFTHTPETKERDRVNQLHEHFSTINFLAYSFYLPVYLHGPPLIYERYASMYARNKLQPVEESFQRLKHLLLTLARIGTIYFINEVFMQFIYANVVIYNPDVMEHMGSWTLYGFAYAMGQFFCNKYIVSYGLGIALATFDRIDAPQRPMCIGRIHLYSHMWRYFDQGLHDFLFKHIYASLCTKSSPITLKLFASFISFVFIYLWHGYYLFLLAWVFLNLTSLYLEIFGRHVSRSSEYNRFLLERIGNKNIQRLNAFFGSQLLIPSIITNLMFLGGSDVGYWLAVRTYITGGLLNYALLSFTAYNFYRVSSFIFETEKGATEKSHRKTY